MVKFELTILGSSSAAPSYDRFPTSQHLTVGNASFLIDCGEGTQMQLMRYRLRHQRISCIFISHLHGDHYFGLLGLLSSMHLNGRTAPLLLFGPAGLGEIIPLIFKHSGSHLTFDLTFQPLDPTVQQIVYESEFVSVETIPLEHRVPCCGFLFREKPKPRKILAQRLPPGITYEQINLLKEGHHLLDADGNIIARNEDITIAGHRSRSYAYCSDTRYHEGLAPKVKDVDLLYHEATFLHDLHHRAVATLHSTALEAALTAKAAGVKKLIIGHYSSRYRDLQPHLDEAHKAFPATELAREGCLFEVDE